MVFIWRGIGLAVPIIFFGAAWVVSFWYPDGATKLGNLPYIGWSSLYAGILLLLIGLATFGAKDENSEVKKKHDFMFIPIAIWGLIFLSLSLYFLVFSSPAASNNEEANKEPIYMPTTRVVNFYNPTNSSLTYIVANELKGELIVRNTLAPNTFKSEKLNAQTYMFICLDSSNNPTVSFPSEKYASDTTKYKLFKDDKGSFYQRKLYPETLEDNDYDEAWIVMDGEHHLAVVEVTMVCDSSINKTDINNIDWDKNVVNIHDSKDLMEPLYNKFYSDKSIKVINPNSPLPLTSNKDEVIYCLIPFVGDEITADYIKQHIIKLCY